MFASRSYRVLYMEDDAAQARLVQKCLEREGYSVDVALDGVAGLRCYAEKSYDAVVVDQTMPLRSGLDVIRDMAARGPLPPTIMVTGTGSEQVAVEAMKIGVTDYLVKDLEGGFVRVLPMAIRRAIRQHRLVEEKRQAEEKLALFRSFAEASVQGFGIGDFAQHVQYANPALCRILGGASPAEIIGRDLSEFYTPSCWKELQETIIQAILLHQEWTGEIAVVSVSGAVIPALQSVFPIRNDAGEPICFGTTITDISDRKRLEQELLQAQKLEAIGQLAAGIAHEINTPIQYIGDNACFLQDAFYYISALLTLFERLATAVQQGEAAASLLHEVEVQRTDMELDYLVAEIPKAISQSLEGVERVASIVGAMKEFSHPGCKQKQAVDLNHAIESTLTISRNEWKYVADMVTDLDPHLPPVFCLPTEINQAVLNIVVNAAHAVGQANRERKRARGAITVSTRRDDEWVEIRVQDTGTGIPAAIHSRVFDPFFTTKDVGQGSGQGLAIVHSIIVERHGGTIRFETQTDQGTTFIIRLPVDGHPASLAAATSPAPASLAATATQSSTPTALSAPTP